MKVLNRSLKVHAIRVAVSIDCILHITAAGRGYVHSKRPVYHINFVMKCNGFVIGAGLARSRRLLFPAELSPVFDHCPNDRELVLVASKHRIVHIQRDQLENLVAPLIDAPDAILLERGLSL